MMSRLLFFFVFKSIAVGTPVAERPPHRSRRAVFPHRALHCVLFFVTSARGGSAKRKPSFHGRFNYARLSLRRVSYRGNLTSRVFSSESDTQTALQEGKQDACPTIQNRNEPCPFMRDFLKIAGSKGFSEISLQSWSGEILFHTGRVRRINIHWRPDRFARLLFRYLCPVISNPSYFIGIQVQPQGNPAQVIGCQFQILVLRQCVKRLYKARSMRSKMTRRGP